VDRHDQRAQELAPARTVPPRVRMSNISKRFGRVSVLNGVSFDLLPGEVHILAGENGAGKSTLIKILAGVHTDFEGHIELDGREVRPRSPWEANHLGVAVIHQELSLIGSMNVTDNLFLGRAKTRAGFVLDRQQEQEARQRLERLGVDVDVRQPVERLPIATQQCIEIAKAVSRNAKAIVMDEPTSSLSEPEVERLFALIGQLKAEGCGIIYISHRLEEMERIADRITVLRDGSRVGSAPALEVPRAKLIQWMVGRNVSDQFVRKGSHSGASRLRVRSMHVAGSRRNQRTRVDRVSLDVGRGEVVGLGGLQGSGASELLFTLFGGFGSIDGEIEVDGTPVRISSPRQAIDAGVALLTNDRKATGLVLPLSITANITLASLPRFSWMGWRRESLEKEAAIQASASLQLRAASLDMPVETLSGGNQQKAAIAKWLQTKPRLLLLDEPTRGIDVGAKNEIYDRIEEWTANGVAILLITSEMSELLALSDRVVVMHRGQITAEYSRKQATAEKVLAAAMGTTGNPAD
jgi:ribose transport system ATP-binding protein